VVAAAINFLLTSWKHIDILCLLPLPL
jgi:hypothetical protein